ncbi:alkaline phosphatase family protein [Microbacterium deminutum]|uniref:Alkaline phosphatase family protein n=1 Tax=Microbacterium deminutum TaxID=344164 RepID=A0ABN2QIB4_9MICO
MPAPDRSHALDHIVVVMFENRSFDHLLGRLYEPGDVPSFEGVIGKDLSNPIPAWAEHGAERSPIAYGIAEDMDTPNPDPGEEYQHVNTQLFGVIDPLANRGVLAEHMTAPYNLPATHGAPTMDGFVTDYISAFTAERGIQPSYEQYSQIMKGYTPEQLPVLSTLARGFGTFDHWFAEVPSQTFTNRSFFHAATASGLVVNSPYRNFPTINTGETIFERLEAHGQTWKVYVDSPAIAPFTGLIHGSRLKHRFATHFVTTDQFYADAANGELPTYSFIEPNLIHGHNDMHPPIAAFMPGIAIDAPSAILGGEAFLAKLYEAIRSSSSATGSNWWNTLFIVVFDEHGGTYDHVPPPAATPPDPAAPVGQYGFTFDRLGVRLPAILVSPWIDERTVITDVHHHTSVIRTLRERWQLGDPLTRRDADAPDLAPLLTRDTPRPPREWPDVHPQPVPDFDEALVPLDKPLSPLAKAIVGGGAALARLIDPEAPDIPNVDELNGAEALQALRKTVGHLFPLLQTRA